MANTYYDSQLTAEEIEQVLEAINGILTQANNGKVLAISNGKIEARSVQWGGGGGAVVQPFTATQNGVYNPPSGVDGYAPVTVNVQGGGGDEHPIDYTFLPNSDSSKVLVSSAFTEDILTPISIDGINVASPLNFIGNVPYNTCLWADLGAINTDVTCYCVAKRVGTRTGELLVLGVPYTMGNGYDPCFDFYSVNGTVQFATWGNNTVIQGSNCMDYCCLAIAVNGSTKKARFFYNAEWKSPEKTFGTSGSYVCFGRGLKDSNSYDGDTNFLYVGAVKEFESDATVIANMQIIMQKLGMT